MRTILVAAELENDSVLAQQELFQTKVIRSFQRSPALVRRICDSLINADMKTPGGIIVD